MSWLPLLMLLLAGPNARAQDNVIITLVERSIQTPTQAGQENLRKVTHAGPFNEEIRKDFLYYERTLARQFVRQDSGPFDGNLWRADSTVEVTPVDNPTGDGAWGRSLLRIQFTVTREIECEFSCSVAGGYSTDRVQFKGSGSVGTIAHVTGTGDSQSYRTPGRIMLTPGKYYLDAECYAQGSSLDSRRAGEFHFELKLYPRTCSQTRSLSLPNDFRCNETETPVFPSPTYANGRLELQCVKPSCIGSRSLQVRWVYPNGEVRYIGICRYACGVNGLDYQYDACSDQVTQVRWSNAEGFWDCNILGAPWFVHQDPCHGAEPNLYEKDHYIFDPRTKHLEVTKFTQKVNGWGRRKGPFAFWGTLWSGDAPTDFCDLYRLHFTLLDDEHHCLAPDQFPPRRSFTSIVGTADPGHIYLTFRDLQFGLRLQGGETADQVAVALGERINASEDFIARGITARPVPSSGDEPAALSLSDVPDEDLSITATGQGPNGVRFVGLLEVPRLNTALSATNLILSWPINALGFVVETTTNPAAAQSWTPVASQPLVTNGMNVLTAPVAPGYRFFRLHLP